MATDNGFAPPHNLYQPEDIQIPRSQLSGVSTISTQKIDTSDDKSTPSSLDEDLDEICEIKKVAPTLPRSKNPNIVINGPSDNAIIQSANEVELVDNDRHHIICEPIDMRPELYRQISRQSYKSVAGRKKELNAEKLTDEESIIIIPDNPDVIVEDDIPEEFLVHWDGPDDPQNPLNWTLRYKSFGLACVALQTLVVVFYSTSYVSGTPGMMKEFNIHSSTTMTAGVTTYLLGLASGPLLLAPLSEIHGRKPVYVVSLALFVILTLPVCFAHDFATIVAIRYFAGLVGSATISNSGGSIADMFLPKYRSTAISIFAIAPMNGPSFGPIMGGYVFQYLGWRWLNYLVLIFSSVMWLAGFLLKETYAPAILRRKALLKRRKTGDDRYRSRYDHGDLKFLQLMKRNMIRPIKMLFTEPICIFWALYIGCVYGILYMCFVAYPIVFTGLRHWSPGLSGLSFLGIMTGTFLAIFSDPFVRSIYNKHKVDPATGKPPPEALIWSVCVAAVLIPIGIIWFAWTCEPRRAHWAVPICAGIPFGTGTSLVFIHGNNYLLNSYSIYAASALAGNAVVRSTLGGVLPLLTPKLYARLGPEWAATFCALLAFVLMPIPFLFYKYGGIYRRRSKILMALADMKQEWEK